MCACRDADQTDTTAELPNDHHVAPAREFEGVMQRWAICSRA